MRAGMRQFSVTCMLSCVHNSNSFERIVVVAKRTPFGESWSRICNWMVLRYQLSQVTVLNDRSNAKRIS